MTNFKIKDDIFFTLEKSEGNMDFPRKFLAKKVSGTEIKIRTLGSNEALLVDVWHLDNFTINGVAFTDVHEAVTALQPILWNEASGESEPPIDYTPFFEELIDLAKTDESYQLFEDTDGNVLFGVRAEDGTMKFFKPDGSVYTGDVKPYSRELKQTITDYCADSVPYTLIQFRDADTKEVVASIWRNDNDLSESETAPANATKGVCTVPSLDYTAVLNSIDTKASNLETIVTQLDLSNEALGKIHEYQTYIFSELIEIRNTVIDQLAELILIKDKIEAGNISLSELVTLTTNIDTNINTIKNDIALIKADISEIKDDVKLAVEALDNITLLIDESNDLLTDLLAELDVELIVNSYEKNNGTINYIQRDTILWDSETGTEISNVTEYSIDGTTWTTTAPAGDVNLGFLNWGSDTFQLEDCAGNPIGPPQRVIKVVQLAKQVSKICNVAEITDPIVDAINSQTGIGKKQHLDTWITTAGEVLEIPAGKFSTISLMASKGEFWVKNTTNDFSSDFTITGGSLETKIEISADGIGTLSGATDVPNSIDTRANAYDMDIANNSFRIECIRDGVLTIEVYK
jgi:hypothetical protein